MSDPDLEDLAEEDGDGLSGAAVDAKLDGFHQQTALHDKGQFLGELADLVDGSPDTRAVIEAEQAPPQGCQLIVVAGPGLGAKRSFKAQSVVIGRDQDSDLWIQDISVSRRHAEILFENGRFRIEDGGSNNGTYLNGERVAASSELVAGDEIAIGETTFRFIELNEAPPTQDSVPIVELVEEGSAYSKVGLSQIDVKIAEPKDGESNEESPRGRALRRVVRSVGLASVIVLTLVGAWFGYRSFRSQQLSLARSMEAQQRFLQAVALVETERFGDAVRVLERLEVLAPDHPRLQAYRSHALQELNVWQILEQARSSGRAGAPETALGLLSEVPSESAYADDAEKLALHYERTRAERVVRAGRRALAAKELDEASRLAQQAISLSPGSVSGRLLLQDIQRAKVGRLEKQRKRFDVVPKGLEPAVAAYVDGRIEAALQDARPGTDYRTSLEDMKTLLQALERAHRAKSSARLLELAPRGLELDRRLSYGKRSHARARIERSYADGLYLRGIEQLTSKDAPAAFRWFQQALSVWPNHREAKARLGDLEKRASAVYYQAQIAESQDPERARRLYNQVTKMTSAASTYHQLARKRQKLLEAR